MGVSNFLNIFDNAHKVCGTKCGRRTHFLSNCKINLIKYHVNKDVMKSANGCAGEDDDSYQCIMSNKLHLSVDDTQVFIPDTTESGHSCSEYGLDIVDNQSYFPPLCTNQYLCSPVVCIKPHGAKFLISDPAIIVLPVSVHLEAFDEVTCWYSDTNIDEEPIWKAINPTDFQVLGNFIAIKTIHFSFFASVVTKGYPEATKKIIAGIGGTLDVPEVPGVKVVFSSSAVMYDIEATIKVMYADGPYDVDHDDPKSFALAAPVVKLGPTGHHFNPKSIQPVEVHLPLPNGREIVNNCNRPYLTFWHSTSAEGQKLEWKIFHTKYTIVEDEKHQLYVRFFVEHFTFFRVLWSILDSAVHEAKIGASFFYPNFEFYVSFQAFMSENVNDAAFGLCCLCFKTGTEPEKIGNYPVFVGGSGPRMVKSGLLQIRIVSKLFEANADFGEETLTQQEFFSGRPFDKQFACKFSGQKPSTHGPIGKVYVERVLDDKVEPLFDFLLTKPSSSHDLRAGSTSRNGQREEHSASWEGKLSMELATVLSIKTDQDLGDDVWEDVARALGYTPFEVDIKFRDENEPIPKLLDDYKKRGGNVNDFISAMYRVGRRKNVSSFKQKLREALPPSDDDDVELDDDVIGCAGSISPSRTSSSSGVVLPSPPFNMRKRQRTEAPNSPVSHEKLSEVASSVSKKWKSLGRALEVTEDKITEIELNYQNDGVQEQAYQMLVAWQEKYPEKGKEDLSQGLRKLQLNKTAYALLSE